MAEIFINTNNEEESQCFMRKVQINCEDSNAKSTADSCMSWVTKTEKSPSPLYEPEPFNLLSPWKYDSNTSVFANFSQNSFLMKTPKLFSHSPIKSPFRVAASWTLASPLVFQKENISSNQELYKSSCFLNFSQSEGQGPSTNKFV